jgi:hypothetical protein
MDENKPNCRWLRFGIRDLLWAMMVVGLLIGWSIDRSRLTTYRDKADSAFCAAYSSVVWHRQQLDRESPGWEDRQTIVHELPPLDEFPQEWGR